MKYTSNRNIKFYIAICLYLLALLIAFVRLKNRIIKKFKLKIAFYINLAKMHISSINVIVNTTRNTHLANICFPKCSATFIGNDIFLLFNRYFSLRVKSILAQHFSVTLILNRAV